MRAKMTPDDAGYPAEVARMAELGFADYGGTFEHADDLRVSWDDRTWVATCPHVHDDEQGDGVEGDTPTQALGALLMEIGTLDSLARRVAATSAALRALQVALVGVPS